MLNKILLVTDLSKASDAVIECAEGLKRLGAEEFILFHALGIKHTESLKYPLKKLAEPELERQLKILKNQGVEAKLEIATFIPSEEILKYAEDNDISLIVIGSDGESASKHRLFRIGGVTSEVLHHHTKPLLVIRTTPVEKDGMLHFDAPDKHFGDNILFATDFSDNSYQAFEYLKEIAKNNSGQITLFHVQDKTKIEKHLKDKLDDFNKIDYERLDMMKKTIQENSSKNVETKIVYGNPIKEILEEAKKQYTLVVMGSQGRGFFEELFIGSVSHNVVRNATAPVMLIPAIR